ncbi:MAG: ribonuclease R [Candidatus Tectimicrobiota bacterium]
MAITDKQILRALRAAGGSPMSVRQLLKGLKVPARSRPAVRRRLKALAEAGRLVRLRGNRYSLPEDVRYLVGLLTCHPDGYGFVVPEAPEAADVYIGRRAMGGAMHGDRVEVRLDREKPDGRREGTVVHVIERGHTTVPGRFVRAGPYVRVIPDDPRLLQDISIPSSEAGGAKAGQVVLAEITQYPARGLSAQGRIVAVLGWPEDPEVEVAIVAAKHGLAGAFSAEAEAEADSTPDAIPSKERARRVDCTELVTVTIDPLTARDYDDAVSIEARPGGGWRLFVHIADVAFYVAEGGPTDDEALERGCTVYFPDRAIPMLPEALSTGRCTLSPDEEKLAVTVTMDLAADGALEGYEIAESVIRSNERMIYADVAALLEGEEERFELRYAHILESLLTMAACARVLRARRLEAGSIDFDLPEADIILDSAGRIEAILKAERTEAHQMIEEFMLLANQTVARHLTELEVPMLYRIHEPPDPEKMGRFAELCLAFGHILPATVDVKPATLQRLLEAVRGRPEERLLSTVMLRSMMQARYAEENLGHFGLAFEVYTHFTSPIRRYPDLIVHRLLKATLPKGRLAKRRAETWARMLPAVAEQCSERERIAEAAEREMVDLKKCHYMLGRIGERFDGYVSGVVPFGFFVELEELFVEGLVRLADIPGDYFVYDETTHTLIGDRSGKVFRLGDRVRVEVADVDIARRQIDFTLARPVRR